MSKDNKNFEMIRVIKEVYGLDDKTVAKALIKVPREKFVPKSLRHLAYMDNALSIGLGQTISQPYTVAFMTHLLDLKGNEKILEIGTGSGYQAAVLSLISKKVYSAEIVEDLAFEAKRRLKKLGYNNVFVRPGQGEKVWKDKSPFDRIIVTAGIKGKVPQELFDQLKDGGILVAPIGSPRFGKSGDSFGQTMTRFTKRFGKITKEEFGTFSFVPFVNSGKITGK